ncbi:MAG: peptidylprolyl isomerase [Frankia sp.]|nr:peptidylprolyl isomerase [Frankia sp.]
MREIALPVQLGPATLLARIGGGGMGVVYYGVLAPANTPVAVKVIRGELADAPEFRARFRREIILMRRVHGLCTAKVYAADPDWYPPYLATEFLAGPTLADWVLHAGPVTGPSLRTLAVALAEALVAIHRAGVVHRDFKPGNVLLTRAGPKVVDFGIAHATDVTALTRVGTPVGTPGYMSPEQLDGLAVVGPAADVFAWGCTVMYAATGRTPFGGGPTDAVLFRVRYDPPNLTGVPDDLAGLVARTLRKDPADRPDAVELLRAALRIALGDGANGTAEPAPGNGANAGGLAPAGRFETDAELAHGVTRVLAEQWPIRDHLPYGPDGAPGGRSGAPAPPPPAGAPVPPGAPAPGAPQPPAGHGQPAQPQGPPSGPMPLPQRAPMGGQPAPVAAPAHAGPWPGGWPAAPRFGGYPPPAIRPPAGPVPVYGRPAGPMPSLAGAPPAPPVPPPQAPSAPAPRPPAAAAPPPAPAPAPPAGANPSPPAGPAQHAQHAPGVVAPQPTPGQASGAPAVAGGQAPGHPAPSGGGADPRHRVRVPLPPRRVPFALPRQRRGPVILLVALVAIVLVVAIVLAFLLVREALSGDGQQSGAGQPAGTAAATPGEAAPAPDTPQEPPPGGLATQGPMNEEGNTEGPGAGAATGLTTFAGPCEYRSVPSGREPRVALPPPAAEVPDTPTRMIIELDSGPVTVALDTEDAPCAVYALRHLARQGYYDGSVCHRQTVGAVVGYSILQCGDPTGTGSGTPGFEYDAENTEGVDYRRGVVALVNNGPGGNGAQFFISYADPDQDGASLLAGRYTVIGHVVGGMEVLDRITREGVVGGKADGIPAAHPRILTVTIDP